ncbi:MAG: zinc-ribbon domain-containing protein, partial [Spirochaetaceae bacterium]|nr:zinc-ribbon domain-containing protein [Spirochaetaceae bacterium]
MMSPQTGGGGAAPMPAARKEVFCAKCAKKYPVTSKFCPHCGNPFNPCPRCGSDNLSSSRRCVSCGTELSAPASAAGGLGCSRCGAPVTPGVKFCPNCGNKVN